MNTEFPIDLDERIKSYLKKNNEEWDEKKHFIYIDCTINPPKLIFHEWKYKCKSPNFSLKKNGKSEIFGKSESFEQ